MGLQTRLIQLKLHQCRHTVVTKLFHEAVFYA